MFQWYLFFQCVCACVCGGGGGGAVNVSVASFSSACICALEHAATLLSANLCALYDEMILLVKYSFTVHQGFLLGPQELSLTY